MDRPHHHPQHHSSNTPHPISTSHVSTAVNNPPSSADQAIHPTYSTLVQQSTSGLVTPSKDSAKEQLQLLRVRLERAEAIQRGAENLLHQVGAGQGLTTSSTATGSSNKRKDPDQTAPNPAGGASSGSNQLHASVEAELDLANRNVKGLVREIEALEALTGTTVPSLMFEPETPMKPYSPLVYDYLKPLSWLSAQRATPPTKCKSSNGQCWECKCSQLYKKVPTRPRYHLYTYRE